VKYLTAREILVLNARIVEATGGIKGVRDVHLLGSLIERPKSIFGGREMFPTVFEKTAVYLESLAKYHVFIDGNKRTALAASARFLYVNGYRLSASNKAAEEFVLRVAAEKIDISEIAEWFKKNTKKL